MYSISSEFWAPDPGMFQFYSSQKIYDSYMTFQQLLRYYSSLEVASEYFRSGADKISIGSDAVYAAEDYLRTGVRDIF